MTKTVDQRYYSKCCDEKGLFVVEITFISVQGYSHPRNQETFRLFPITLKNEAKGFFKLVCFRCRRLCFTIGNLESGKNDNDKQGSETLPVIPAYLKKGDQIGITSPAGYISLEEIQPSIQLMESWGYKIRIGESIGKRDFTFGGSDDERARDFQNMLDDKNIKAIMCARGGYGAIRIIDKLKWEHFRSHPKWVIGFSDITVFHSHINRNLGIASIHSKMCNSFPDNWNKAEPIQAETILSIRQALSGEEMKYSIIPNRQNKIGVATGILVGGNSKTIESLAASKSDIQYRWQNIICRRYRRIYVQHRPYVLEFEKKREAFTVSRVDRGWV